MHRVITGTGLATAQGVDVKTNWQRLINGAVLHDIGRVPLEADASVRVSQLAIHVARQALAEARWTPELLADPRTALVVGTSKGPIDTWLATHDSVATGRRGCDLFSFGLSQIAADLAMEFKLGFGPRFTLAGACASGLHALIRADELLRSGVCDRALVVAAESSLHPLFQATFKRLGVLANPAIGGRPFDEHRAGFLLAEAAAAVCLEACDQPAGIEIGLSAMRADATHLTGLAPDGDAIANALIAAGILTADLIHAHGTGTIQNDAVELTAIRRVTSGRPPIIYSHKHAIGHTQGAAGLISIVLNVEMHRRQIALPNANTCTPMREIGECLPLKPTQSQIRSSIIHAAGFGGAIAAIGMKSSEG